MGLTSTGPAFSALLADAMLSHAMHRGFSGEFAENAVRKLFGGANRLVAESGMASSAMVTTLWIEGATAAALRRMLAAGFTSVVHSGLEAAEQHSRTMCVHGNQSDT